MNCDNCLDFCELLTCFCTGDKNFEDFIKKANTEAGYKECSRIYFGSSFCGKLFLHIDDKIVERFCKVCYTKKINVTMVIPVFSASDLEKGKQKIATLLYMNKQIVDEITVNDFAMAVYLHNQYSVKINLGRLLMKDYRDPRYGEYFHQIWKPKVFTCFLENFIKKYNINSLEFDPTHDGADFSMMPQDIILGMHTPYCYMTLGRICEYSSIPKSIQKKFRANDVCAGECKDTIIHYNIPGERNDFIRIGRSVLFKNSNFQVQGVDNYRNIFFPIDMEVHDESFSTSK